MRFIIDWLNKKALKNALSVELSIGRVFLKPLTNGIVNNCKSKSCIVDTAMNDALFFQLMDYELTNMSKKQIDSLTVKDGSKLRNAVKDILRKHGVIRIEAQGQKDNKEISIEDAEKLKELKKHADEDIEKWQKEHHQ